MRIERYDFGVMVVDGRAYYSDLKVFPDTVYDGWWRREGHRLVVDDLHDVLDAEMEVFVVGTGSSGMMKVDEEVLATFAGRGVELVVRPTREAVEEFNRLEGEGKVVVGAFHLTC